MQRVVISIADYFYLSFGRPLNDYFRKTLILTIKFNKMKNFYFVGIYKHGKSIILQAVTNKDYLSCELVEYFGARETTKENLKRNKKTLFQEFKKQYPYFKDCTRLIIE